MLIEVVDNPTRVFVYAIVNILDYEKTNIMSLID